jgi:hypothetical protein
LYDLSIPVFYLLSLDLSRERVIYRTMSQCEREIGSSKESIGGEPAPTGAVFIDLIRKHRASTGEIRTELVAVDAAWSPAARITGDQELISVKKRSGSYVPLKETREILKG